MFLQAPLEKFWSMYMEGCGVSKVRMKNVNDFEVLYIWESDFRKNKQENINKCINFLKYE